MTWIFSAAFWWRIFFNNWTTCIFIYKFYISTPSHLSNSSYPDMSDITKKYQQLLSKVHENLQNTKINLPLVKEAFEKQCVKQIQKINYKLKIVMDNDFAQAMMNRLKKCVSSYSNDFKRLESNVTFMNFLCQVLLENQFVTTRERRKIQEEIKKIKKSRWYQLHNRLSVLALAIDKEDFRDQMIPLLGFENNENQEEIVEIYQNFYKDSLKNLDKNLFIKVDSIVCKFQNRQELLGLQLSNQVDEYFGQHIGKTDQQLKINQTLLEIAEEQSLQSNQEHLQFLNEMFEEIKKILNKFSAMRLFSETLKIQLHLARFGSIISGFATRNTDMDLTILTNCYIDQVQLLKYLDSFIKAEFKQKKNMKCKIDLISNARIPLLKLKLQTNRGQAAIDLIINNILGVINSKFLAVYGNIPWIRHLGVLIKLWAKKKNLVGKQIFSSYSLNLLLIHFLIETRRVKLIMDARERDLDKNPHFIYRRKIKREEQQKFPVYFQFKTKPEDVTSIKRINLYEILTQFFIYFSKDGKHWKFKPQQSIITVDGSKAKQFEDSYIFTIKDPFDEKHNPGRVQTSSRNMVENNISQAVKTLQSNNLEEIAEMFRP